MKAIGPQGRQLTSSEIASTGGTMTVALSRPEAQILRLEFGNEATVTLTRTSGIESWFASSPNAPFPDRFIDP